MNLLSWFGNAAQRVGNTLNNDLIKPVQRDVIQPVAHAASNVEHAVANAPQTFQNDVVAPVQRDVFRPTANFASRSVAQVNPFDNGRTWQHPAPTNNFSFGHQLTHNGFTNVAGGAVKFIPQFSADYANTFANLGNRAAGRPNATIQQNFNDPLSRSLVKMSGATGKNRQLAGDAAQIALSAATPAVGKVIDRSVSAVAPKIVPKVISKVISNAGTGAVSGAPFNVANYVASDQPITAKGLKQSAVQGAQFGAALGAGGTIAGEIPNAVRTAKNLGLTPPTNLNPAELLSAQKAARQAAGWGDQGLTLQDAKNLRSAQQKLGVKPGTPQAADAIQNAVLAHHAFEVKLAQRLQALQDAKAKLAVSNEIGAVGKNVNKAGDQAHAEAKGAIEPTQSNGVILKETKPRGGKQDVLVARKDPNTGKLAATVESRPVPQSPPDFLKPEGTSTKPALKPNIELDRSIQNTLKNGTAEDAVQTVMDTTGADLQTASKYVSRVAQQSKIDLGFQDATKNPKLGTVSVPKVKTGDYAQPNLNAKFVMEHEHRVGQQALDSFNKLTPHDQVLLKQIETGTVSKVAEQAKDPAAFKQAEQNIRNYYDLRHAYDRYLGIDVGYRTNYLRQIFNKVEQQAPNDQISLKGSNKKPGYTHERTNETLGADVAQALQKDISGASFNHAKLAYEQGINEATGGKVAKGELVRTPQDGNYVQLQNKFGQDLSVPKDIAHAINSRTWGPAESKTLNTYDKINHGLKYIKLSGGAFHALTEAGNFVGQQIGSGKLVTNPAATGKLFKVFFSPKAMSSEMQRLTDNGTIDKAHLAGLTLRPKDMLADVNVPILEKGANKVFKATGIQALHDATFAREMPYAKIKLFEQKTQGLDVNKPADLAKMRKIARGINNLVGGINREVHGIKPNSFKWLQRGLLATDFTEAKIATLFSALSDKGPAGTLARQAVLGKALLFGLLASAGAAAGGEYQGKTPGQIAKNAAGNLLDPQFTMGGYTAKLPKTHISEAIDALKPTTQAKGAPWNASGLIHYAQSRTAALPSEAIQLATNKNYYGQPIYGKNTKKNGGGPISPAQTGLNAINTVAPIPFGQILNSGQGKQNWAAGAANIAGLNVRPTPAPKPANGAVTASVQNKLNKAGLSTGYATKPGFTPNITASGAHTGPTQKELNALSPDATVRWKNMTAAAKQNYAKNNPTSYLQRENARIQSDLQAGKITDVKAYSERKSATRTSISSQYNQTVRDLYGQTKTYIANYLSNKPNGGKLANDLIAYDNALVKAGVISKGKFATGIAPSSSRGGSRGGSRRRSGGSSKSGVTAQGINAIAQAKIKAPKLANATKLPTIKGVSNNSVYKAPTLRKYSYKAPTIAISKGKGSKKLA